MAKTTSPRLERVADTLRQGLPIMIFDSGFREAETDLVFPAQSLTGGHVRRLRQQAGGLLFLAISHELAEQFRLPDIEHLYAELRDTGQHPELEALRSGELKYDTRSAFSLTINHRDTFTGISDRERAHTARRFAELAAQATDDTDANLATLGKEFRTPGHVAICRAVEGGLANRRGHTELMVAAAQVAEITPVMLGAEILEQDGDRALPVERARQMAADHGIPMIEGQELVDALCD